MLEVEVQCESYAKLLRMIDHRLPVMVPLIAVDCLGSVVTGKTPETSRGRSTGPYWWTHVYRQAALE